MKRIITLGIAAILSVGMTACGETKPPSTGQKDSAKQTATPTATEESTPVSTPTPSPEPVETITGNKAFLRAVGNGEAEGSQVRRLVGQVFNIDQEGDGLAIQMWLDEDADEQAIVYIYDDNFDVSEDDYLSVSGTIGGQYEGENAMGGDLSVPTVEADRYKTVTAKAMHPTLSKSAKKQVALGSVQYTVQAEYAADQTRFVITAVNHGSESESVETDPNVVSNGRQKESESNYDSGYPELSYDLAAGATTKGVLIYKKLRKGKIQMIFEGYDADYNEVSQTLYF